MTVSTVVDHNDYTGNGVTTSFPYTFRIFKKTDLAVSVVDLSENITVLVLDTDYTVTNAGGYNGGSVVLTTPLANGWQISIARELEPTQETDLRNQGKFFAEVHEDAFDKLTMLIQQAYSVFRLALRKPSSVANWYDALNNYIRNLRDPRDPQDAATKNYVDTSIGRTLRVPDSYIPPLPPVDQRKNKLVAMNDNGDPLMVLPASGSASDVMIELAKPTGSSNIGYQYRNNSTSTKRKVSDVLNERVSLWDFHCDSNGNVIQPGPSVDSRQYIQNAIDALYDAGGGTLIIPTGTWYLNSYGVPDKIANYGGVIHWRSRVNIHFEAGATLKLTDYFNERGYCVICGFDGNDPKTAGDLRDAMITGNGTIHCGDNVQAVGGSLSYAIGTGKSYNVDVRDVHITGGDLTWAVTLGWNGYGSNTVVDRVTVTEVKKTDVNRNVDQSLFYVGCQFSGVQNCYMRPSESGLASKISAAVELHQSETFCLNNQMYGFMRGVYVVLHGTETTGSSLFMSRIRVSGNTAFINGQFVTIGADSIGYSTHVSDVIISDNICTIMNPVDSAPLVRCFIASDLFVEAPPDNEVARVLVDGNIFLAPTTTPDSLFFFYRVSSRSFYFSNNICDCRRMVSGDGAGTSFVELRDIIWDSSNKIGSTWLGLRGGNANMFEFYVANILRCKFEISMPYEDSSIANIFYAPDTANITYTVVKVAPENVPSSVTAVGISAANKNRGTNYFEFPASVAFSSFNSAGAVFCYSTSTDYAWCGSATALSKSGVAGMVTPGEYGVKDNGQLGGVGYNDTAVSRNWNQRVLLKSAIE